MQAAAILPPLSLLSLTPLQLLTLTVLLALNHQSVL